MFYVMDSICYETILSHTYVYIINTSIIVPPVHMCSTSIMLCLHLSTAGAWFDSDMVWQRIQLTMITCLLTRLCSYYSCIRSTCFTVQHIYKIPVYVVHYARRAGTTNRTASSNNMFSYGKVQILMIIIYVLIPRRHGRTEPQRCK